MNLHDDPFFLALHTTYTSLEIGVFKGSLLLASAQIETKKASSDCLPSVEDLLKKTALQLSDLACIAAYKGPAPFTTLRVALASVNGLGFALKKPLIGVNGLECFLEQEKDSDYDQTIVLLQAFGKDLYTGIYDTAQNRITLAQCLPLSSVKDYLRTENYQKIKCVGNGARIYTTELLEAGNGKISIPESNPETCSLQSVARIALSHWKAQIELTDQIIPLYLKNHPAQQTLL